MDERSPPEPGALPEELVQFVKPELRPGERLLWAARELPRPSAGEKLPFVPFYYAIAFIGLSVGLFYAIFGPFREKLIGAEVLMISAGMISAMIGIITGLAAIGILIERWSSGDVPPPRVYALTDRRAILWRPHPDSSAVEVHAVNRGSITSLHRLEYPDGSGDVMFRYPTEPNHFGLSGFEGVADVRRIEDLVRRTLVDTGSHSPT